MAAFAPLGSWLSVGISCLSMSGLVGAGCGKSGDKAEAVEDARAEPDLRKVLKLGKKAVPPPEIIRFSHNKEPGFQVPLEAAARFGSINPMLPGPLRPTGMWTALELTMADGSTKTIEEPRAKYGEGARYVLQPATPGQKLVVLDKGSEVAKASFGPLASIHVTTRPAPMPEAPPFPMVIDGVEHILGPEKLDAIAMVVEPAKGKPAWALAAIAKSLSPGCALAGLSVVGAKETFDVEAGQTEHSFLRVNKKNVLMFSVSEGKKELKRVRGVSRIEASCAPQ